MLTSTYTIPGWPRALRTSPPARGDRVWRRASAICGSCAGGGALRRARVDRRAATRGNGASGALPQRADAVWAPPEAPDQAPSSSSDGGDAPAPWAAPWEGYGLADPFLPAKCPEKAFVILRHGSSTWNEQGRIQGNTDESELTPAGREQALRAREALSGISFDSCFSSPHTRARQTAELVCDSPIYLDSLRECDLGWLQGMRNDDIALRHPDLYRVWREEPELFCLDGRYPVRDAFRQARRAWADMLAQEGRVHLVVTHKSILRAMLCTALGLPPSKFRAIDISNGAVCMLRSHERGINLSRLNLTTHLALGGVRYRLPKLSRNDNLLAQG